MGLTIILWVKAKKIMKQRIKGKEEIKCLKDHKDCNIATYYDK